MLTSARGTWKRRTALDPPAAPPGTHYWAWGESTVNNWGSGSTFNIWNPSIYIVAEEFSLTQLWVTRGTGSTLETIETGFQVYPKFYGDSETHFFIYFTPDNYGPGGCYKLTCSGFVQTNSNACIGCAVGPYSTPGGDQYEGDLAFAKAYTGDHWWLYWFGEPIGYYPKYKFDGYGLRDGAAVVQYGAEVTDYVDGAYTLTDMGSGQQPSAGWGYAAYQADVRYSATGTGSWSSPTLTYGRSKAACWDIAAAAGGGIKFFVGGGGYNGSTCALD